MSVKERELLVPPNVCPLCHQTIPARGGPKRVCSACDLPIKLHHKWLIVNRRLVHRSCQNPEEY